MHPEPYVLVVQLVWDGLVRQAPVVHEYFLYLNLARQEFFFEKKDATEAVVNTLSHLVEVAHLVVPEVQHSFRTEA